MIITVSGLAGVGKTTLAKTIAEELGFKYISVGKEFRKRAKEKGVDLLDFLKLEKIDREIDEWVKRIEGNVVIDGRITGWMRKDAFKIWIFCEDEERIKRVMKRDKIDRKEAEKMILERDKIDKERYKKLYGIDLDDWRIYDLIINNSEISMEEFIELGREIAKYIKKVFKKK